MFISLPHTHTLAPHIQLTDTHLSVGTVESTRREARRGGQASGTDRLQSKQQSIRSGQRVSPPPNFEHGEPRYVPR